jgi:hypothetical protein
MLEKLKSFWKKVIESIKNAFVWVPPENIIVTPPEPESPLEGSEGYGPTIPVTDGDNPDDPDTPAEIIKAIWVDELKDLTPQELDELAALFYEDDPDVEIVDISAGDPEAGEHHGVNTEDEMLGTYDPNQEYVDEPWEGDDA